MSDWYDTYQAHASSDWGPTQLNPEDEQKFRSWIAGTKWFADVADDVAASGEQLSNADLLEDMIGPNRLRLPRRMEGRHIPAGLRIRHAPALALVYRRRANAQKPATPHCLDGIFHARDRRGPKLAWIAQP